MKSLLLNLAQHLDNNKEMCKSPPGFVENKSSQTNTISFCDRITGIEDRGENEGVICFDSSKVFTISLITLVSNLEDQGSRGELLTNACKMNKNV